MCLLSFYPSYRVLPALTNQQLENFTPTAEKSQTMHKTMKRFGFSGPRMFLSTLKKTDPK